VWSLAVLGLSLLAPAALAELKPGEKVPDVTLKDLSGKSVKFSRLRGSAPVLVNFFATW
jgi:peroxiredoxin